MGSGAARHSPAVEAAIGSFPGWQADVARAVRARAHEADPAMLEEVRYGNRPYFLCAGRPVCALQPTKDHLNVFLYDGALAPDPAGIVTDGHGNATARQIRVTAARPLDEAALLEILRWIAAANHAGGWRRLAGGQPGSR